MMKRLIAIFLAAALLLAGCGKEEQATKDTQPSQPTDPNAIARVTTGDITQYANDVKALETAVAETGNSSITLLQDISVSKAITLPYSCTLDLNGHTITTNPTQGIGLKVEKAGSECKVTTISNGTIRSYADCLRIMEGALVVSNAQLFAQYGTCVALYDPSNAHKTVNRIEQSLLYSVQMDCFSFKADDTDYKSTGITIADTQLICAGTEGEQVFSCGSGSTAGVITLGQNAAIYSYARMLADDVPVEGGGLYRQADAQVEVDGQTLTGIGKWAEDRENQVLDVLMIGNSFCYNFTEELHGMAAAEGIQLNLTNLYYGGRSIKAHADRLKSNEADYEYWITNDFGRIRHPQIKTLTAALAYGQWDVITAQQHFDVERTVDYETALASCTPYAKDVYDYLKTNHSGAKLYWQQTWAYQVGYPTTDNGRMPVDSTAVQTRQHNQIRDVSIAICQENGVDRIPTGDAWSIARGILGDTLCKADCCHDGDTQGGQYLNACVWFEVLTGRSCLGNSFRPGDYPLDESRIGVLQQAAHDAVAALYGADYAK